MDKRASAPYAIAVFHNITDLVRKNRMRREFMGEVAHELRTPLTTIIGFAETILDLPPHHTEDRQKFTGIILRKANELKTWLDRLFNVGIEVHKSVPDAASKEWQMAESLMADGKTLAYRHALMCCIDPSDDIKVDSTLKALAKDPTVSERIIERLKV